MNRRTPSVVAAAALLGCSWRAPPLPTFEVDVEVHGDPGQPVAGAVLRWGERVLGRTEDHGGLGLRIRGREGERVAVSVACPEGFASPREPLEIALRRTVDATLRPRLRVRCPPTQRQVVVAVRATGGPGLPIVRLGAELGRTDEAGVGHVLLEAPPGEQLQLELDTSERPDLSPRNPSAVFEVADEDAVFLFDQTFTRRARPRRRFRRPDGPERI